jgi:hypothetical protein
MNLFSLRLRTVAALLLCSLFAFGQSGDFAPSAILQLNIDQQVRIAATANDLAVEKYKLDFANWTRNVDLLKATNQPAVEAPKPPRIVLVDKAKFASIFSAYADRCISQAMQGLPCGEFDASSAFTSQLYPAIAQTATKPPPAQPDIPLGDPMGGGFYAVAPGDQHPEGYVYTNPIGLSFKKYVLATPFGVRAWFQSVQ